MKRCFPFLILLLLAGCHSGAPEKQRSFYFWKSQFKLSSTEAAALQQLTSGPLYIKLFDIDWNEPSQLAMPVAQIRFQQAPPAGRPIIPVIFITNETLLKINTTDSLAAKMARLAEQICSSNGLKLADEVQIDCDWTATTKDLYFELLQNISKQPFLSNKKLSVTIRLHQLKFRQSTGIPPADKGLLMCYNMGNLADPEIKNSILDTEVLKEYSNYAEGYPLPLDAALPVFDWYVLFRDGKFKALLQGNSFTQRPGKDSVIRFRKDTTVEGFPFESGDWLRYERPSVAEIKKAAAMLAARLRSENMTVVLYHLDDHNLKIYPLHEMEAIFHSFD